MLKKGRTLEEMLGASCELIKEEKRITGRFDNEPGYCSGECREALADWFVEIAAFHNTQAKAYHALGEYIHDKTIEKDNARCDALSEHCEQARKVCAHVQTTGRKFLNLDEAWCSIECRHDIAMFLLTLNSYMDGDLEFWNNHKESAA
jgi:hypothetical protein